MQMALSYEFCREEARNETDDDGGGQQDNERQISIDPMSWKQPPALPQLAKPKFASASLPSSATSSPESFRKWSSPIEKPHPAFHHHSTWQPSQHKTGVLLPRSKSCGDGRSSQPSDEFDILSVRHQQRTGQPTTSESRASLQEDAHVPAAQCEEEEFKCGAMCLFLPAAFAKKKQKQVHLQQRRGGRQMKEEDDDDDDEEKEGSKSVASRVASLERFECASWSSQPSDEFDILSVRHQERTGQPTISESGADIQEDAHVPAQCEEEEFKCGAMCLFLPAFVRKKQPRRGGRQMKEEEDDDDDDEEKEGSKRVASRVASLERFECASWSSAAILDDIEDDGVSAYFDLPLELIRGNNDDTQSPVRTAFMFERERKGVLKKSSPKSGPRKSHDGRHVRFSTSQQLAPYPTSPNSGCVTPRLFQAREEFNAALLEAQNASINF